MYLWCRTVYIHGYIMPSLISIRLIYADSGEPTSGLEPLTYLITSVRSVVAEHCRGVQIPHRKRVFCSLYCTPLQGIAFGLGSN